MRNLQLTLAVTLFAALGAAAGEAENSVTHVVTSKAHVGVKSYGTYKDWPHVEIHVRPGEDVIFDGKPSWKMERDEYEGWVLQKPEDPGEAEKVLKLEHFWKGALAEGRRLDVRVRGNYGLKGGEGAGGVAVAGGGQAAAKPLIWTVLSLDLDLDADSDRRGEVVEDNYSAEADQQDAAEDSDANPVGAFALIAMKTQRLVLRRLMPAVRNKEVEGPPLSEMIEGYVTIAPKEGSTGEVSLCYTDDGKTYKDALETRRIGGQEVKNVLVSALWDRIVAGKDVNLVMEGTRVGTLTLVATLIARPKGDVGAAPAAFSDQVRVSTNPPLAIELPGAGKDAVTSETLEFQMWLNPAELAGNGLAVKELTPCERFNAYDPARGYVRAAVVVSKGQALKTDAVRKAFDDYEAGRTSELSVFSGKTFVVPAFYMRDKMEDPLVEPEAGTWRWRARILLIEPGDYYFYACARVKPRGKPELCFPAAAFPPQAHDKAKWTHDNYVVARFPHDGKPVPVGAGSKPGILRLARREGENHRFFHRCLPDGTGRPVYLTGMCRFVNLEATDKPWIKEWRSGWVNTETEVLNPLRETGQSENAADVLSIWLHTADSAPVHCDPTSTDYLEEWEGFSRAKRVPHKIALGQSEGPHQYFDQGRAQMLDGLLVKAAEDKLNVYVMMTVWGHPDLRVKASPREAWPNGNWGRTGANGTNPWYLAVPPNGSLLDFVTRGNPQAVACERNYYRYLVARYSGYRSLGLWEGVSEYAGIQDPNVPQLKMGLTYDLRLGLRFADGIKEFMSAADPYRHPHSSASQGWDCPSYLGGDYVSTHAYGRLWGNGPGLNKPEILRVLNNAYFRLGVMSVASRLPTEMARDNRPWFHGEEGLPERTEGSATQAPQDLALRLRPPRVFKGLTTWHYVSMLGLMSGAAGTPLKWNDAKEFGEMRARISKPGGQDYCQYFRYDEQNPNYPPNFFDALKKHKAILNSISGTGVAPWAVGVRGHVDPLRTTTGIYNKGKEAGVIWIVKCVDGAIPPNERVRNLAKYVPTGDRYHAIWLNPWTGSQLCEEELLAKPEDNKPWIGAVDFWVGKMEKVEPEGFEASERKQEDVLVLIRVHKNQP